MLRILFLLCLALTSTATLSKLAAQTSRLQDWTPLSEDHKTTPVTDTVYLGKPCVKLDGHAVAAIWDKADMTNFRLEFDLAGSTMAGVGFRATDEQNYQLLYFRPGYGGTIEAMQYIPIYNGALSWVFYGAYQASADIHKLQWFHAAIEVRGDRLRVFTNGKPQPDMDIRMQRQATDGGSILLRTLFGEAYFANFTCRPLPENITQWEISSPVPNNTTGYEQVKKMNKWRSIDEPGDDYVNLSRYYKTLEGTVIAKHTLHADSAGTRTLSFDFTGTMQIWLNGREVYHYEKYKLDRVEQGTYAIRLSLQKGDNELAFITRGDDFFFGKGYNSLGRLQHQNWGFIAAITKR